MDYIAQCLSLSTSGRQYADDVPTWLELSGVQKTDKRSGREIIDELKERLEAKIRKEGVDGTI